MQVDHRPARAKGQVSQSCPAPCADPLIRLIGVTKRFGSGEAAFQALKGVDLDIVAGDFMAVMGPSGSGKSTTMNILGCLDVPTSGQLPVPRPPCRERSAATSARCSGGAISASSSRASTCSRAPPRSRMSSCPCSIAATTSARGSDGGAGGARQGRAGRLGEPYAVRTVGRPAAARRDRARDRHPPRRAARRRADRQSRQRTLDRDHGVAHHAQPRQRHHRADGDARGRDGGLSRAPSCISGTGWSSAIERRRRHVSDRRQLRSTSSRIVHAHRLRSLGDGRKVDAP